MNIGYYEIIIRYNRDYSECIIFFSEKIMNDSNDVIMAAVELELLLFNDVKRVCLAQAISEFEYEKIRKSI